jgi:hypothetical protein
MQEDGRYPSPRDGPEMRVSSHSAPLGGRSTYFPSGIFRTHSQPQQWYVIVA